MDRAGRDVLLRLRADDGLHLVRILPVPPHARNLQPSRCVCVILRLDRLGGDVVPASSRPGLRPDGVGIQPRRRSVPHHGHASGGRGWLRLDDADMRLYDSLHARHRQFHGAVEIAASPEEGHLPGLRPSS